MTKQEKVTKIMQQAGQMVKAGIEFNARGFYRNCFIPKHGEFVIKWDRDQNISCGSCAMERRHYQLAKAAGLSGYFAEWYGCFTHKGITYHVYEKVQDIGLHNVKVNNHWGDYREVYNYSAYLKKDFIAKRLDAFCYVNGICDLHDNNAGWSKRKNHLVITDYAGC